MFENYTLEDWEKLVQKQLKTDDIYSALEKENLEDVEVKPYYEGAENLSPLPKVADSPHLVAPYLHEADAENLALLLHENVENLAGKTLFIDSPALAEHISPLEENTYFSLIDPFQEQELDCLNLQLTKELLAKGFERSVCVDVALHQNAGASIVQQLAFAVAKAKDLAENFGEKILSQLVFRIAVGRNYFFEIAKIRALKLLFNQLTKEYVFDEIPFVFAETSMRNKTRHDPENNLIRSTLELSAAMCGGADAVFSHSYLPAAGSSLAAEISFKQQLVLAYEGILNVFEDAANGSYLVEDLTRQFAEKSWQLFIEMEAQEGYCEMVRTGKIQQMVFKQATREQAWVAEGKIKLTGVNLYPQREAVKQISQLYRPEELRAVRLAELFETDEGDY